MIDTIHFPLYNFQIVNISKLISIKVKNQQHFRIFLKLSEISLGFAIIVGQGKKILEK